MKGKNIVDCIYCFSHKIKKHGIVKNHGQRYKCNDCNRTFTLGGTRGTYNNGFKERVVENYCHRRQKAADMVTHYGISTATLIKRSKDHKKECIRCCTK